MKRIIYVIAAVLSFVTGGAVTDSVVSGSSMNVVQVQVDSTVCSLQGQMHGLGNFAETYNCVRKELDVKGACGVAGCTQVGEHMHNYCGVEGCTMTEAHEHGTCGYAGCTQIGEHMHNYCGVEGCTMTEAHEHGACGVAGCTQIGEHMHNYCGVEGCTMTEAHSHRENGYGHHSGNHGHCH